MPKETKTQDIEVAKLATTLAKLRKEGWMVTEWNFSDKGAEYSTATLEREKAKPAKKASSKKK